jgi:drug/metabolite transporter (DMT)-like permease
MTGSPQSAALRPTALRTALAFATVYVIWGSTYLAIRFAIETIPPFLMAGTRFLVAGAALYAWVAARGQATRPTRTQWAAAALLGGLFFLGGNGGVTWAEQLVPSGLTSLVIATVPLWLTLLEWRRTRGARPDAVTSIGLLIGFAGVALLLVARGGPIGTEIDPLGGAVLLGATWSWAAGTIYAKHLPRPPSLLQTGAMQMLAGGALLWIVGGASGEIPRLHAAEISARSLWSLIFLIVAGSAIAFSAYAWLVQTSTPSRVGTYAYVNPVVAVALGWTIGGESIGPRTLLAGAIIVAGVALIITARGRQRVEARPSP